MILCQPIWPIRNKAKISNAIAKKRRSEIVANAFKSQTTSRNEIRFVKSFFNRWKQNKKNFKVCVTIVQVFVSFLSIKFQTKNNEILE